MPWRSLCYSRSSRGFQRIFNIGFATTMTLFGPWLGVVFGQQSPLPCASVVVWMSIVTALPCFIAAALVQRMARA